MIFNLLLGAYYISVAHLIFIFKLFHFNSVWPYKDPSAPPYPEKDYKIAKDMLFKV